MKYYHDIETDEIDSLEKEIENLKKIFIKAEEVKMFNINNVISEFIALTEMEKQTKKRIDELKTLILEQAGDATSFMTDDYTIVIKQTESIRLDTKELYKDFPDIKKTYGKASISKSIVAAKRGDTKTA